tara:strand:+ start:240 stop:1157 length:918 start_codon:yes stop_codon:yes gene_type:complete
MKRTTIKNILQVTIIILVAVFIFIGINNLAINLIRTDVGISFNWLFHPSGFAISESSLGYKPADKYIWALFIGWINSIKIIASGLLFATIIGALAGIARMGSNKFLSNISAFYVAIARQTPLLLQLLFWYFVVFLSLPDSQIEILNSSISISNKNIMFLGLNLSVEFCSLFIGLTLFTGASISEVIRGGLNSIEKGQIEASRSIGLSEKEAMQLIIFPQALPAILPGLTSQYLNLAKNSTLAIAVGYPDIYAISDTVITQTGRTIEGFLILLLSFLALNLIINRFMGIINNMALRLNRQKLDRRI